MDTFKDITVLSLEQATVLPYLTYRLAHDGMNVIRLEHPVYGDPNRMIGENVLGEERMNAYFLCINSGKKALTLNLGDPEGQKIFKSLLKELNVDVFATNQLPRNYQIPLTAGNWMAAPRSRINAIVVVAGPLLR